MIPRPELVERNPALGYAILFFVLMFVYGFIAYRLFAGGALRFGAAMTALTFLMAGLGVFSLREFLILRFAEWEIREIKKGKEKK